MSELFGIGDVIDFKSESVRYDFIMEHGLLNTPTGPCRVQLAEEVTRQNSNHSQVIKITGPRVRGQVVTEAKYFKLVRKALRPGSLIRHPSLPVLTRVIAVGENGEAIVEGPRGFPRLSPAEVTIIAR